MFFYKLDKSCCLVHNNSYSIYIYFGKGSIMRILLRLALFVIVVGGLGLMAYVSFIEVPNNQTVEMIDIPFDRYAEKL